ncbi:MULTISPECIES: ABC transporter substrate-binding protein [Thermocrispum]|jgi:iron complex transport system substrate-binding protein|uniref:ABC transporter substrate-binding protein n=1 Tax=Thermocrispum agreste TaxID=37925 RepID=A0ABD6FKE5_9PSEU|nr:MULTISPECIES: ABC transporter substrate-binding protein [Thermocrispum]
MSTRRAGAQRGDLAVNRRGILLGGAGLAALFAVGACGKVEDRQDSGTGGPWSFVDDRKREATAKSTPTNIVAQISAAAALWDLGIKPVGVFGEANGPDDLYGNVDLDAVTWVGKSWGEFDMEKFLDLRPHLLVAPMNTPDQLWYVPEEMADKVAKRCPTVGIKQLSTPVDKVIQRYADLAASLGADLDGPAIADARKAFTAAVDELRAVAEERKDLKVAFVSAAEEFFYWANPDVFSDALLLRDAGINLVQPDVSDEQDPHWDAVSWEQVARYDADVLLYDSRNAQFFTENLDKYPTLANLPAVKAKQLVPWNLETPPSWAIYAPKLRELADKLRGFQANVAG